MSIDSTLYLNLPVPEIVDQHRRFSFKVNDNLSKHYSVYKCITFPKQKNNSYSNSKQPPKLYRKPHRDVSTNRSFNSSMANSISFRESRTSSPAMVTPIYTEANQTESYFEEHFEILSKLGEGSFGEVFKVRSKEDGLLYAVKKSKQFYKGEHYRQVHISRVLREYFLIIFLINVCLFRNDWKRYGDTSNCLNTNTVSHCTKPGNKITVCTCNWNFVKETWTGIWPDRKHFVTIIFGRFC